MTWLVNGRIDDDTRRRDDREGDVLPGPGGAIRQPAADPQILDGDDQGCDSLQGRLVLGRIVGRSAAAPMPEPSDSYKPPFLERNEGFGLTCLHCHASSEKESTFASLNNIKGFPGNPLGFFVDETWRNPPPPESKTLEDISPDHRMLKLRPKAVTELATHAEFLRYFKDLPIPAACRRCPPKPTTTSSPDRAAPRRSSRRTRACRVTAATPGTASRYTMILEGYSNEPGERVSVRRVAVVADGAGRQGSDLLRPTGQRAGLSRGPARRTADRSSTPAFAATA